MAKIKSVTREIDGKTEKLCTKCQTWKDLEAFHTGATCKSGYRSRCKICTSQKVNDAYHANPDAKLAYNKGYYKRHRKRIAQREREYRARNQQRYDAYYASSSYKERKLRYRTAHRERANATRRVYARARERADVGFKISNRLRARCTYAIKRALSKKVSPTLEMLGIDMNGLLAHLSSLFSPGMSWENYGHGKGCWHVDHIRPCASFDLTRPEEQRACFHYTNLQPLWSEDNIRKGAKWTS